MKKEASDFLDAPEAADFVETMVKWYSDSEAGLKRSKQMEAQQWARRVHYALSDPASVVALCYVLSETEIAFSRLLSILNLGESPDELDSKLNMLRDIALIQRSWKLLSAIEPHYTLTSTGRRVLALALEIEDSTVQEWIDDYRNGELPSRIRHYIPTPLQLLSEITQEALLLESLNRPGHEVK